MPEITLKQAKHALSILSDNWYSDEEKDYGITYDVEDPESVPTIELEPHDYKNLRVLEDYLNQLERDKR
tara:strand:+ start:435 stop:641 length:207 start_codon:yes stop_codon:yes gene_type:complete